MLKFSLFFGFLLLSIFCNAQTPAFITEHGYRFYHHINLGGQKPKRGETIKAYVNVFIGDTLVSSSRKNLGGAYKFDIAPEDATLDHYPPLMDAALLMGIGDSATIFQPLDTAMRRFVPKNIKNAEEIRFEIALSQIISAEDKAKADQAFAARAATLKTIVETKIKDYASGALNNQLTTTQSGLKMLVAEKGSGRKIKTNEAVQVHYYGYLINGTSFDNSFDRRQALAFPVGVGQMIPGFDEGVSLLNHGSKAYLFIPSELGYGASDAAGGAIPANSELIFYIEVL
jgi:FKBP-type peptidyl-prolyl cis-trans isomerase